MVQLWSTTASKEVCQASFLILIMLLLVILASQLCLSPPFPAWLMASPKRADDPSPRGHFWVTSRPCLLSSIDTPFLLRRSPFVVFFYHFLLFPRTSVSPYRFPLSLSQIVLSFGFLFLHSLLNLLPVTAVPVHSLLWPSLSWHVYKCKTPCSWERSH